jgi:hypothetical protein
MIQPANFVANSIWYARYISLFYRLKQMSRSWNIIFDKAIKSIGSDQNPDEPCVYKRCQDKMVIFLMLYVDGVLLIM